MKTLHLGIASRLVMAVVFVVASLVVLIRPASASTCPTCGPLPDLRSKIVANAESQVGVKETGNNCNPYGPCAAWCAMFARWTWDQAGGKYIFTTNVAEGVGTWGKAQGLWKTSNPMKGDIVVWSDGALDGGTGGHVSVIESVSGTTIHSIDGNWSNQVSKRTFSSKIGTTDSDGLILRGFVSPQ